jgi:hypothetical protein
MSKTKETAAHKKDPPLPSPPRLRPTCIVAERPVVKHTCWMASFDDDIPSGAGNLSAVSPHVVRTWKHATGTHDVGRAQGRVSTTREGKPGKHGSREVSVEVSILYT